MLTYWLLLTWAWWAANPGYDRVQDEAAKLRRKREARLRVDRWFPTGYYTVYAESDLTRAYYTSEGVWARILARWLRMTSWRRLRGKDRVHRVYSPVFYLTPRLHRNLALYRELEQQRAP